MNQIQPKKFSQYFGLDQNQEFEFVDIYIDRDLKLFLDPYGIMVIGTKWGQECESQIASYFQHLVTSIKNGDKRNTKRLLNALHEVDEIGLGYSSFEPRGRGIGIIQAQELQNAFENSQAMQSGDVRDIADCALLIPGISRDKISDITANILKNKLIEFTQQQCRKHNIPTKKIPVNDIFDFKAFDFKNYFTQLPIVNGKPKILLPITAVRRQPNLSKDKYYRNFVIEFLKAEHSHAGDSLANVLKNGKIVVFIRDLKKKYPMKDNFLYEFSKKHPKILNKFKEQLKISALKKVSPKLAVQSHKLTSQERINYLTRINTGDKEAQKYHKISFDNISHIFGNRFSYPRLEEKLNEGRKRVDIFFNNSSTRGFFHDLNSLHRIQCPKIIVECKNYKSDISNPEIDQLQGRFNKRRGMFGILLCRQVKDKKNLLNRCKDVMNDRDGFIIVLDDTDVINLLKLKEIKDEIGIDSYMSKKLDELIL